MRNHRDSVHDILYNEAKQQKIYNSLSTSEAISKVSKLIDSCKFNTLSNHNLFNMSKFFAGQGSSSDSEQDSDSSSDGGMPAGGGPRKTGGVVAGRAVVYDSDSSSEDEKRVVISHKDKAFENMLEGIGKIKNACKNNDWSVIYDEFVKVNTLLEKARAKAGVPKFYIKMLSELGDFVAVSVKDKEAIKKMKKPTAHALNQMKLLARKQAEKFPKEIEDFKAHPELYADEVPAVKKTPMKKVASDSDSESEDSSDEVRICTLHTHSAVLILALL
jgi:translation initiation factor 3 subunit C